MSQSLCLVDRAMHVGSFRCMPCERRRCRVHYRPVSRGRGIMQCSPSLCIVRCSFSPASGRLSTLTPCPSYRTPFPSLFSSFVNMVARTPASSSGPPLLSFISPSAARTGRTPCFRPYLHSMHRLCIPFTPPPPPMRCFPSPFSSIKSPWTLLFFFIPFPRIRSRATKSSRHCEARFVSLR